MQNITNLLKQLKKSKKAVFLGAILIIFEGFMELLLPIFLSYIINNGIGKNDMNYTILMTIIMSLITLIGMISGIFSNYYSSQATCSMSYEIRNLIITKISKSNFSNLDKIKVSQIVTIMNNDIPIIENAVNMGIRILIRLPIILIGSVCLSILLSPKLSLLMLLIIPVMCLIMYIIMKTVFPYFDMTQDYFDEVNSVIRQNISGIKIVKSFRKEKSEIKKFNFINKKLKDINIKAILILSYAMPSMLLIINITTILILWLGGNEVIFGNFEIGNIMALIQYLTSILSTIMLASLILVMVAKSEVSAKRINSFINIQEDLKGNNLKPNINGKIEFKNVSFEYEQGKGDYVLKNINLVINPGEHVGIIGPTGSGKSSLINLIPRYYDVSKGEILIDDINIKQYDIVYLRKNIKICMQKAELFSGTILSNIRNGNFKISLEEVNKILKIVELEKFVKTKKNNLKYKVEQKGDNLSGGEKQRLNLARTLVSSPDIIILDDTASSLDLKTTEKIRTNLNKFLKGKTLIVISSRLSLISDFDKIIVINDGKIDNIGTHDYLLKNSKVYKDIYNSQYIGGELNG